MSGHFHVSGGGEGRRWGGDATSLSRRNSSLCVVLTTDTSFFLAIISFSANQSLIRHKTVKILFFPPRTALNKRSTCKRRGKHARGLPRNLNELVRFVQWFYEMTSRVQEGVQLTASCKVMRCMVMEVAICKLNNLCRRHEWLPLVYPKAGTRLLPFAPTLKPLEWFWFGPRVCLAGLNEECIKRHACNIRWRPKQPLASLQSIYLY